MTCTVYIFLYSYIPFISLALSTDHSARQVVPVGTALSYCLVDCTYRWQMAASDYL